VERRIQEAFAVWVTGLPASGKSTIVAALTAQLMDRGVDVAVLESDALRQIFTPHPHYDEEERATFYRQLAYVGALLTRHGVPVIFDATANRRIYRDRARQQIPRFLEVYVDCPLETCMSRDPKGIYRKAREGAANTVPGLQATYEPPKEPDLVVLGDRQAPEAAAKRIIAELVERGYLGDDRAGGH
jgi:adenylylsulfate kinase